MISRRLVVRDPTSMMLRCWVLAGLLVAGCGGGGGDSAQPSGSSSTSQAATTTTTATTGGWLIETADAHAGGRDAPVLLVTDGAEVERLANGRVTRVGTVDGTAGVAVGDGVGTV
jgi:hypothetical protein